MLLDTEIRVEPACPARWRLATRAVVAAVALAASLLTLRPPAVAAPMDEPAAKLEIIDPIRMRPGEGASRILDPAGRPFAGAKVYRTSREMIFGMGLGPWTTTQIGVTDADGSIRYMRPPRGFFRSRDWIVASAEGFGPALLSAWDEGDAAVGRLARDDVPIRGRVIDRQGRPVLGAEVVVETIFWNPGESVVDEWVEAMKKPRPAEASPPNSPYWNWACGHAAAIFFPPVATGDDGRFIIRGVGRDRPVHLRIQGGTLRPNRYTVVTREMPPITRVVDPRFDVTWTLHGATCELVVETGRVAAGTVVDDADGRPIAGAKVWFGMGSSQGANSTLTDRQGRYRLEGLPSRRRPVEPRLARADVLNAERRGDDPYPAVTLPLIAAEGVRPIRLDFRLRREGR